MLEWMSVTTRHHGVYPTWGSFYTIHQSLGRGSVSCCLTSTCQACSICLNKAELWLQAYVDEVEAEARAGGAYGVGTERHLDGLAMLAHLPAGAELATVSVSYRGYAVLCLGDS